MPSSLYYMPLIELFREKGRLQRPLTSLAKQHLKFSPYEAAKTTIAKITF